MCYCVCCVIRCTVVVERWGHLRERSPGTLSSLSGLSGPSIWSFFLSVHQAVHPSIMHIGAASLPSWGSEQPPTRPPWSKASRETARAGVSPQPRPRGHRTKRRVRPALGTPCSNRRIPLHKISPRSGLQVPLLSAGVTSCFCAVSR